MEVPHRLSRSFMPTFTIFAKFAFLLLTMYVTACRHGDQPPSITQSESGVSGRELSRHRLSIRVLGNKFVNEKNQEVKLLGVSIMGMEYTGVAGFSPDDPFPQMVESTWEALKKWHVNVIRIPLNEISYLGLRCIWPFSGPAFNNQGDIRNSDPGHNYKARLKAVIDRATSENLYVILDLHATAPDDPKNAANNVATQCAYEANPLPDLDHAVDFWRQLATEYKGYPNVMFELFNNPYIDKWPHFKGNKVAAWESLRDGIDVNSYLPLWPTTEKHPWRSAGMQQLLNAVRSTGATNVVLQGGLSRSADLELWLTYKANDPLKQIAASWHAFPPKGSKWGSKCYSYPAPWCDDRSFAHAARIIAANYPVIVTEFGDMNYVGATRAPFAASLLPRLDDMGISYVGWGFVPIEPPAPENQLVKDNVGTPTDGYGTYVKSHYGCAALGLAPCSTMESTNSIQSKGPDQSADAVDGGSMGLPAPM